MVNEDLRQPAPLRPDRPRAAALRSQLMLETAAELVGRSDWSWRQARIELREQGGDSWRLRLFGSDSLAAIDDVARGEVQFGIVNPAVAAALAVHGAPPFGRPIPLRAIATEPSYDQLGFAVKTGLRVGTLAELVALQPPIELSLRAQRDHSVRTFIDQVLGAAGMSLEDIDAWGGRVRDDEGLPHHELRRGLMDRGEIDALFDEGIYNWVDQARASGFAFLSLDEPILERLEGLGHRRAVLDRTRFPALPADVATIDFSGFLVYTHAGVPDEIVTAFCASLDARHDRIPWQGTGGLPLRRMVNDAVDAPIPIPFHPAAEQYWREHRYLD